MTAARQFAQWSAGLSDVPDAVTHAACRHLLDGFGTAIAASKSGAGDYAVAAARALGSSNDAQAIGQATRVSAPAAALANGVLVHALDFDDTHTQALVHPTSVVLPVAFAMGEATEASGADVLRAAVAGYEMVARLGMAAPHAFHERGIHATSVCGVFAAALIASRLMGLDEETTTSAIGIAGSMAAGSLEFLNTGASTKQLHPGFAAMSGILAANLASNGAQGPDSILEGGHGLYASLLGLDISSDTITAELGQRWETKAITIKPYPLCHLSHASLDALSDALGKTGGRPIVDILFDVPAGTVGIVCEPSAVKARPRTAYDAKFSLSWCAALFIVDGSISVSSFDSLDRPEIERLAKCVRYEVTQFESPPATAPGAVTLTTQDGKTFTGAVPTSRGGPKAPLSDADLRAKFTGNGGSDELAEMIFNLNEMKTVSPILEAAR